MRGLGSFKEMNQRRESLHENLEIRSIMRTENMFGRRKSETEASGIMADLLFVDKSQGIFYVRIFERSWRALASTT
jgi:hypothetical protein